MSGFFSLKFLVLCNLIFRAAYFVSFVDVLKELRSRVDGLFTCWEVMKFIYNYMKGRN